MAVCVVGPVERQLAERVARNGEGVDRLADLCGAGLDDEDALDRRSGHEEGVAVGDGERSQQPCDDARLLVVERVEDRRPTDGREPIDVDPHAPMVGLAGGAAKCAA